MFLALILAATAQVDPPAAPRLPGAAPEAVLASMGLSRVGSSWLLEDDIRAEPEGARLLAQVAQHNRDIDQAQAELSELVAQVRLIADEIAQLEAQQNQRDEGHATVDSDQIPQRLQELRNQQDLDESRGRRLQGQIRIATRERDQTALEFQALYREILAQYARLPRRDEITEALLQINRTARPWQALGPTKDYQANVLRLANIALTDEGLKRAGAKLALLAEKEVNPLVADLSRKHSTLKATTGAGRPDAEAAWNDALKVADEAYRAVQDRYRELGDDPLITGAVAEVKKRSRTRIELGPTSTFKQAGTRIESFRKRP